MHNNDSWDGPVRGSRAWWRGLGSAESDQADAKEETAPPPTRKERGTIRWDLVKRVKEEIAQGTYDTPEKWDAALDLLLERLNE